MSLNSDPIWLTVKQAMDRYQIGRTKLYSMLKNGQLVAIKCGRKTLLNRDLNDRLFAGLAPYKA